MIHCNGYTHPKPDGMSDVEHVVYHHEQLDEQKEAIGQLIDIVKDTQDIVKSTHDTVSELIDIVENLQEQHKATSNRLNYIEGQIQQEEVTCNDFIVLLVVIGGIIFTAIIIKRGLKPRWQIKPR